MPFQANYPDLLNFKVTFHALILFFCSLFKGHPSNFIAHLFTRQQGLISFKIHYKLAQASLYR